MTNNYTIKIGMSVLLFLLPVTFAQAQMAIGIKGGSTGIGGEFTYSFTEKINARASGTFFTYNTNGVNEDDPDIAYDMEASVTSIGLIADYFPARRGFKLSVGLFYHDFVTDGRAEPNEDYEYNDEKTFSKERLGSLTGTMDYKSKLVPYVGIGVGNPVALGNKVRVNFDIGAMYTNSPQVNMEGEGMIAPTANYGQDFEDGMSDFKFYPVINLGLSFRIN